MSDHPSQDPESLAGSGAVDEKASANDSVPATPKQGEPELEMVAIETPKPLAASESKAKLNKQKTKVNFSDLNNDTKKFEGSVPYKTIFRYADKYDWMLLIMAIIGAIGHGVSQPLMSIIFGGVIDSFTAADDVSSVVSSNAKWFVILGAATFVVAYFQQMGFLLSSHRQINQIRKNYFRALTRQNMGWYDAQEVGALTARISADMLLIKEGMADKVGTIVQMGAMFLGGFVVAFIYSWKMTLVILATVPLLGLAGAIMTQIMTSMTTQSLSAYAAANAVAEEAFTAMRTIVAFGSELATHGRFEVAIEEARRHGEVKGTVSGLGMAAFFFVMFNSYGLAFWYAATLINAGELQAGEATTVFFSVIMGSMAVGQGAPYLQNVASARGAAYAIFQVIDRKPEIDSSNHQGQKLQEVKGQIEFRDVKFTYPTRPEMQILKGLSLTIEPGTTVALVGHSGCGKSTSVGLLERFYDPVEGQVLVDGVDLRELSLPWWRQQVGLVQQEPVLFARTIRENIRYGNLDVTDAQIEEAARRANVHDFIMKLPKQYETLVGERGGQLSGGQKQRVAIARALVRDPKILLLDEATSALDNKSEKIVQDALDKASVGRTTIIIAHRLSTIRQASQIFVIDKGVVVERGTHTELMELAGYYKDLVDRQQITEKKADKEKKSKKDRKDKKEKKEKKHGSMKKRSSSKRIRAEDAVAAVEATETTTEITDSALSLPGISTENTPVGSPALAADDDLLEDEEEAKTEDDSSDKAADDKKTRMSDMVILKRTLYLSKPEWWMMGVGLVAAAGAGVVFPLYAIIMGDMIFDLLMLRGDPLMDRAQFWALMFLALACGTAICNFAVAALFSVTGERLTTRLRDQLFRALLHQEIGWFDAPTNATGLLASRLSTDATLVQSIAATRMSILMQTVATLGGGLIIAFISSWQIALVVLACVPLVAVGGAIQMKAVMNFNDESKAAYEKSSNVASETISNIRTVVSLGRMEEFYEQYHDCLKAPNKAAKRASQMGGFGLGFSEFIMMAVMALAFWYGGVLCDPEKTANPYNFGHIMKAIMAVIFGAMMTGQLSTMAPDYGKARDAAETIYNTIDRVPTIDTYSDAGKKLDKVTGRVSLRDVRFHYPQRATVPILRGLSLDIEPGKTVALVGSSGCGKSTIIQLLERFYDPIDGQVLADGVDVRDLVLPWWREQIGLVQQEPILFACSIGENIRFGKPGATQEEVEAAARLANAHNFISGLPDKYDTTVGERGAQLSGGQKQRIAIARALIRNPKILLLDEATSALDSESEQIVQEALDRAAIGRTTIMIAHRLSTVKNADMIVVIDQGQVIETGTHTELIAKGGFYNTLVQSQAH